MDPNLYAEITNLRARIRAEREVSQRLFAQVEALVERFPASPDALILRGDAIQLGDGSGPELIEARRSYERALELDPSNREAVNEIQMWDEIHGGT